MKTERVVQIPKRKESWVVYACNPSTQDTEAGVFSEFKTYLSYIARLSKNQGRVHGERNICDGSFLLDAQELLSS